MECDHRVYGQNKKKELKKEIYGKYGEAGEEAVKVPEG